MLDPGDTIDRYEIVRELGRGGIATVLLAKHRDLQSLHAIKLLLVTSPDQVARLLREGQTQAGLRHPNVVSVTDILEFRRSPALVMEYVDGPSLDAWLTSHRPDPADALRMFRAILAGVAAAHQVGVVHRDLKPANVLLAHSNAGLIPKVTDFGLVKYLEELLPAGGMTDQGVALGTPEYMAPEQVRDAKNVDQRADIFALGCMLYEMVIGERPFEAPDPFAVYTLVLAGEYVPPEDRAPGLADNVYEAIRRALQSLPEDRLQTCEAFDELLFPHSGESFALTPHGISSRNEERAVPAPGPIAEVEEARPARSAGWGRLGAVVGALLVSAAMVLIGMVGVAIGSALVWAALATKPRPLTVHPTGLPADTPLELVVNDRGPTRIDAGGLHFDPIPPGTIEIRWAAGEGCALAACPGAGCPARCGHGGGTYLVEGGTGSLTLTIPIAIPR